MTPSSCPNDADVAADLPAGERGAPPGALVLREDMLQVGVIAARVRLVNLIAGGSLVPASIDACTHGLPLLAQPGPAGALSAAAPITVRSAEPATTAGVISLPLRWHAAGPGGQQVRVLGAELRLIAAAAGRTMLRLRGEFRLPSAISP